MNTIPAKIHKIRSSTSGDILLYKTVYDAACIIIRSRAKQGSLSHHGENLNPLYIAFKIFNSSLLMKFRIFQKVSEIPT